MKRKTTVLVSFALGALSLASCGSKTYALEDYCRDLPLFQNEESVNVMQLTDLHCNFATDFTRQKAYWGSLMESARPKLIMITGDSVLNGSKRTVGDLLDTLEVLCEEYGAYFGFAWGNHDKEGTFDPAYWAGECAKRSRCIYNELKGDDVYGRSNYVLNLTDGSKTLWQVYALDSNSLIAKNPLQYQYDVIHKDQIEWFEQESDLAANKDESGKIVSYIPSLAYFHIPLWELEYAYRLAGLNPDVKEAPGTLYGHSGEEKESSYNGTPLGPTKSWVGYENTGFFASAESKGVRGMFFGHDHKSDFVAKYASEDSTRTEDNAIVMGYGLKSSDDLTYLSGMTGALVSKITREGNVSFARYYQDYSNAGYDASSVTIEELSL